MEETSSLGMMVSTIVTNILKYSLSRRSFIALLILLLILDMIMKIATLRARIR